MFQIKKILYIITGLLLACLLPVIGINCHIKMETRDQIHLHIDDLRNAQVVMILGAGVYRNKRVSAVAYDRIVRGIDLYNAGKAKKILISGDHGGKYYDEVNTIKHWCRKYGVPDDDIVTDHAGFSTYDSIVRAREVFDVKSVILVTQEFHLPRALYLANKKGIMAQGFPADRRSYLYINRYVAREYLARVKDFIYINFLRPRQKFIMHKIPAAGEGRKSNG